VLHLDFRVTHYQRSIPLGSLALLFYILHEAVYTYRGQPENGLWSCDVALLAVAFGLLIPSPVTNAVGAFWLTAGLPLWVYYLFAGDDLVPTTLLVHLGGLAISYAGMKRLGIPKLTWAISMVALFGLILLSRAFSSPVENINFSYGIYSGARRVFSSYWSYMFAMGSLFTAIFATLQWGLPKLGFPKPLKSF
jgi:hypothetical protein